MTEGPIGGEFISISDLAIGLQNILKAIDPTKKLSELSKCNIRWSGGDLKLNPQFKETYEGLPCNQAVEHYHFQLEKEVNRLDPEKKYKNLDIDLEKGKHITF